MCDLHGFYETTTAWYLQVRQWPTTAVIKFVKLGDKVLKLLGLAVEHSFGVDSCVWPMPKFLLKSGVISSTNKKLQRMRNRTQESVGTIQPLEKWLAALERSSPKTWREALSVTTGGRERKSDSFTARQRAVLRRRGGVKLHRIVGNLPDSNIPHRNPEPGRVVAL